MNVLKWFQHKTGKLPVTMAQAAGITAVVGAAGVAAFNFLSSPAEDNTAFVPPSAYEQGNVVYVAQGAGNYAADGAADSTFKVLPSRSIQLENRQNMQMRQAQALEDFNAQPTFEEPASAPALGDFDGKAYQFSGGEKGLGMGGNKQVGNSFDLLKNIPDQLNGLNEMISKAQAGVAAPGAQTPGANTPGKPGASPEENGSGQSAAALASASRNWGNNGLTRAGGGGGSSNTFVVQNSKKNKGGPAAPDLAEARVQAGDAIEQARVAMTKMREGETLRGRPNFGPSDKLSKDRDASVQRGRNFGGQGRTELARIRSHMAKLRASNTLRANAVAEPYMASQSLSSGLVVDTDNVVIGQTGTSSGDLKNARAQMKGIQNRLNEVQADMDEQEAARDNLKSWLWDMAATAIPAIIAIAALVAAWKASGWTFWGHVLFALAVALTAVTAGYIWVGTARRVAEYHAVCGEDGWGVAAWGLAGVLTGATAAAWILSALKVIPKFVDTGWAIVGGLVGLYSPGMGLKEDLKQIFDKGDTQSIETDADQQLEDENNEGARS